MDGQWGSRAGVPEDSVEVADSSASFDLHCKLNVCRRNGVQECLVALTWERKMRFCKLVDGEYDAGRPDADGVFRSQTLPGLRFRPV